MRTTRAQLETLTERLAEKLGYPLTPVDENSVTLELDYAPTYGGYCLQDQSWVRHPSGDLVESSVSRSTFVESRCPASEMWYRLRFALDALNALERG